MDARIRALNQMGSDVAELEIVTEATGDSVQVQPKVVDAGHHARRLLRLTGRDVEENQARRLLNDLDCSRSEGGNNGESEEIFAHDWLHAVFWPVVSAVPRDPWAGWPRRRFSTRCWSTDGSCQSRPDVTWV